MRESHTRLSGEIQAMNQNLVQQSERDPVHERQLIYRVRERDNPHEPSRCCQQDSLQPVWTKLREDCCDTTHPAAAPTMPRQRSDDSVVARASSLPPSRPRRFLRTMTNLITGQRDTPESRQPLASTPLPITYVKTREWHSSRQLPAQTKEIATTHQFPTCTSGRGLASADRGNSDLSTVLRTYGHSTVHDAAISSAEHEPVWTRSAAGNYVAPSASHESAWLNCEVPHDTPGDHNAHSSARPKCQAANYR